MSDETEIQEDDIRAEHLREVSVPLHWAYLFGLLGGLFVLTVLLIALPDS